MAIDGHQFAYNRSITATALRTRSGMHCICHEFQRSLLGIFPLVTATPSVKRCPPPAARSRLTHPSQLTRASLMAIAEHQIASVASNQNVNATALPRARLAASAHIEYCVNGAD
jgi:hypothetical protein